MSVLDHEAALWLQVRGDLYARAGQPHRGLAMLLLAARLAPAHAPILRTLVGGFLAVGDGRRALLAVDQLAGLEGERADHQLLRSRAFWLLGEHDQARDCFHRYLAWRTE
ncbi:type III secretion protein [Stutzerimonas urumqiensis]|uniref:type III secretion protein n=1 Tax=Stutzerimonas urumqiensis TaxID=638269 RepID=UPI000EB42477|nr:type III secretion protein [Stutzerimonas urumqiensis]